MAKKYGITIKHDTTAAGHSKSYHDQIGGTVKTFLDQSFANHTLQLRSGSAVSIQLATFCNNNFAASQNGELQLKFHSVSPKLLYRGKSPFDGSLNIGDKGIKYYHSVIIDTNGNMKYRPVSCNCAMCNRHTYSRLCNQTTFAGRYTKLDIIPAHVPYNTLRANQFNNSSNRNNNR